MSKFRTEKDSMGEIQVPEDALYAAQTQRAVNNFPISGLKMPRAFIRALGLIKQKAARFFWPIWSGCEMAKSLLAGVPSHAEIRGRRSDFRVVEPVHR